MASLQGDYPFRPADTPYPAPVLRGEHLIAETNAPESEPVSNVDCLYVTRVKTGTRSRRVSTFLDYILSARLLDLIREERGGTYYVSFATEIPDRKELPWLGAVDFRTRPEMTDQLVRDVRDVMARMAEEGPTAEEMELARKYLCKRHGEVERRSAQYLRAQEERLRETVLHGRDYDADGEDLIGSVKARDVRNLARKFVSGARIVEIYTEE